MRSTRWKHGIFLYEVRYSFILYQAFGHTHSILAYSSLLWPQIVAALFTKDPITTGWLSVFSTISLFLLIDQAEQFRFLLVPA